MAQKSRLPEPETHLEWVKNIAWPTGNPAFLDDVSRLPEPDNLSKWLGDPDFK